VCISLLNNNPREKINGAPKGDGSRGAARVHPLNTEAYTCVVPVEKEARA